MKVLDYDGTDHLIDKIYDAINSGGSADYITEEGTHGSWYYRKWASGIAECWCRVTQTVTKWQAWGNVWEGTPYPGFTFPSGLFIDIPSITANVSQNSSGGVMCEMGQVTQSGITYVIPIRPISTSNSVPYQYFVHARGLWKAFTPSVSRATYPLGDYIIYRDFDSESRTLSANSYTYFTIPITVPDGYKYLCNVHSSFAGDICPNFPDKKGVVNGQVNVYVANTRTYSVTGTATIRVLFVKDV